MLVFLYRGLATNDYTQIIWTTFSEWPGTIMCIFTVDYFGRKKSLILTSAVFTLAIFPVAFECSLSKNFILVLLFVARMMATGFFQTVYLYTPEAYPTNLRALAMGKYIKYSDCNMKLVKYVYIIQEYLRYKTFVEKSW